jgi:DNA ligase-associated metallophosphoesterase
VPVNTALPGAANSVLLTTEVGGEPLQLLHQRAAYLPHYQTLLVADVHIGKAQSFRRLGVPVPGGTTAASLQRLTQALAATGARHLVFLGDLLHSAHSEAPATWAAVAAWRASHPALQMTLVRGNHDQHAGDPPAAWGIHSINGPLLVGGLALCHHPEPLPGSYVLAGHTHPAVVVGARGGHAGRGGRGGSRFRGGALRLPCFHFGPQVGVLPAFGEFTGMHTLTQQPGDRVFVIAEDTVRALTTLPAS